ELTALILHIGMNERGGAAALQKGTSRAAVTKKDPGAARTRPEGQRRGQWRSRPMSLMTDPNVTPPDQGRRGPPPGKTLKRRSHGLADTGRVRPSDEDHFLIARLTKSMRVQQSSLPQPKVQHSEERGYLFLVADGMGGHNAGEQASALAVRTIEEF